MITSPILHTRKLRLGERMRLLKGMQTSNYSANGEPRGEHVSLCLPRPHVRFQSPFDHHLPRLHPLCSLEANQAEGPLFCDWDPNKSYLSSLASAVPSA